MSKKQGSGYYDSRYIRNADMRGVASEGLEEILEEAQKSLKTYNTAKICVYVSLVLTVIFPPLFVTVILSLGFVFFVRKRKVIMLEYCFDDNQASVVKSRMDPLVKIAECNRHWWISQKSKVADKKYHAGASGALRREKCKASLKAPFPFKTDSVSVSFCSGSEKLLFLPDKLIVFQGSKISVQSYAEIVTTLNRARMVERGIVPKDTRIVDYTWEYVNKSGGPDRRFKNNRKLPVCLYGEMEIRSKRGVNTDILFSNPRIVK